MFMNADINNEHTYFGYSFIVSVQMVLLVVVPKTMGIRILWYQINYIPYSLSNISQFVSGLFAGKKILETAKLIGFGRKIKNRIFKNVYDLSPFNIDILLQQHFFKKMVQTLLTL